MHRFTEKITWNKQINMKYYIGLSNWESSPKKKMFAISSEKGFFSGTTSALGWCQTLVFEDVSICFGWTCEVLDLVFESCFAEEDKVSRMSSRWPREYCGE